MAPDSHLPGRLGRTGGGSRYRPAAMPEVDVVVVSYNSADHLRECVEPLAGLDWVNVVVVDSASADDSLAQRRRPAASRPSR